MITDEMLDDRIAIVGTAGSGKTYTAKGAAERLIRSRARVCIIDPLGVWWGLRAAARAILAVLASRAPAKLTWTQAATLAGLKARGGHFNAGRQQLRDGLIEEDGDLIAASRRGLDLLGETPAAPTTPAEVRAMWCAKLPSPAPEMIEALASGRQPTIETLAAMLGKRPRGGHWNGGIAVLRNNGLVTIANGTIRLSEDLRNA